MNKITQNTLALCLCIMLLLTPHALAAEGELLSIDWTLIVQIIIFIAAIFILNSLLYKPLLKIVDRREQLTTGAVKEAKELREKVEKIKSEYREKLDTARNQAIEERSEIRREAQAASEDMIGKARGEAHHVLEEAKAKLRSEIDETKAKLNVEIQALSREMASRILSKEV